MSRQNNKLTRITTVALILLVLGGILLILRDWQDIVAVLRKAIWYNTIFALLFTALSYLGVTFSLMEIYKIFNIRLARKWQMLQIGFLSFVSSYMIYLGGITGVSVRLMLMKRRGIAAEDILAPSLFHSYIYSLVSLALSPLGFFPLFINPSLSLSEQRGSVIILTAVFILILAFNTALFLSPPLRAVLFAFLSKISKVLFHRDINHALMDFECALVSGINSVRQKPMRLALPILGIVIDWAGCAAALWFCFASMQIYPDIGALLCGFVLGITLGSLSMIPAGLGVMELSMAGVFSLFGIPFNLAVLAAILFRLVYYFIPFIIGTGLFYRELKEINKTARDNLPPATAPFVK